MMLAEVEVRMLCRPCFRGKHGQCDRTVTYLPAAGGSIAMNCECQVAR